MRCEAGSSADLPYRPAHPEILRYDDVFVGRFLDHAIADPRAIDARKVTRELGEQIYHFRLFTPEFCELLIDECERCGGWVTVTERSVEPHSLLSDVEDDIEPDTTHALGLIPGLSEVYDRIVDRHVRPVVEGLWRTWRLQKWDPGAVRRFEPDVVAGMEVHFDAETVGMIGYLNRDFTGGGTHFPRWGLVIGSSSDVSVGSAVVYPGGVSHEHGALPITRGRRYTLANSFY